MIQSVTGTSPATKAKAAAVKKAATKTKKMPTVRVSAAKVLYGICSQG